MKNDKTKLWIAAMGFGTAVVTMLTAVAHLGVTFFMSKPVDAMTTNAPGTNSAGTNAAADPKHAVPGNTGTVDYKELENAAGGIFIDWPWVALIVGLLVALLCILVWKRIKRRHRRLMEAA